MATARLADDRRRRGEGEYAEGAQGDAGGRAYAGIQAPRAMFEPQGSRAAAAAATSAADETKTRTRRGQDGTAAMPTAGRSSAASRGELGHSSA